MARDEQMTDTKLGIARAAEMCAVFMIGDGLLGLFQPSRHVTLWRSKIDMVDMLVRRFDGRPGYRRGYGTLQLVAGLALASRLKR